MRIVDTYLIEQLGYTKKMYKLSNGTYCIKHPNGDYEYLTAQEGILFIVE